MAMLNTESNTATAAPNGAPKRGGNIVIDANRGKGYWVGDRHFDDLYDVFDEYGWPEGTRRLTAEEDEELRVQDIKRYGPGPRKVGGSRMTQVGTSRNAKGEMVRHYRPTEAGAAS